MRSHVPTPSAFASALTVGMSLALSLPASAQFYPPAPASPERTEVRLRVERPLIEGADFGFLSSVWDVDVAFPVSERLGLVVGVPVALGTGEDLDPSVVLGNLRATLVFGTPDRPRGFLGLAIPTATGITDEDYAFLLGSLPRLDRPGEWVDEFITLRGGLIRERDVGEGKLGLRVEGAINALTEFDDGLFWLRSGVWGQARAGAASLRAELSGGWILNQDDGFGRNSFFYFDAGADFDDVPGRPGLFVRVPLDENARRLVNASFGVHFVL